MVVLHHEVVNTHRIAGNFRGVKYFLYFRGQADLHEFFTPRNYRLYGIQRGHIKSFTHSWGQLCVAQPVPSPHPGCHGNMLHTVTWLCPYHHMHSHGSSGRGQHPHNHHFSLHTVSSRALSSGDCPSSSLTSVHYTQSNTIVIRVFGGRLGHAASDVVLIMMMMS